MMDFEDLFDKLTFLTFKEKKKKEVFFGSLQ